MMWVAAAKLRRAQEQAEAARPYAERMQRVLSSLAASVAGRDGAPPLLAGRGTDKVHLFIVMTSDRGLCGAFNSSSVRGARRRIRDVVHDGRESKILCVGRKARDQLRRDFGRMIVATLEEVGKPRLTFAAAEAIARRVAAMYEAGEFDTCTMVYNRFKSVITQVVTFQQLIPFAEPEGAVAAPEPSLGGAVYEYEPDEDEILADLLPRNLAVQIYKALLENAASEQGARMTAMDSATRNAGDMINRLTMNYNRTRQAVITKELIEIISGAEAL
jgi:F-type H+-transporting ATPase subunit gamma